MNRARDRELRFSQRYDVVNHLPRVADPSAASEARAKAKMPDTRTGYDIIHHGDNRSKPWHDPRAFVARGPCTLAPHPHAPHARTQRRFCAAAAGGGKAGARAQGGAGL